MRRVMQVLVGIGACALLAACSTDAATELGPNRATLNGSGIGTGGPTAYRFEYAKDAADLGTARDVETTVVTTLPADAPFTSFARAVSGLAADTDYTYRTCWTQSGSDRTSCAGTRTFHTTRAVDVTTDAVGPSDAGTATTVTVTGRRVSASAPMTSWFEYVSEYGAFGDAATHRTPARSAPATPTLTPFSEDLAGLEPLAGYRVRACVRAQGSAEAVCGDELYFNGGADPLPICEEGDLAVTGCGTLAATDVGTTTATLNAKTYALADDAEPMVAYFEYGAPRVGHETWARTPERPLPTIADDPATWQLTARVTGLATREYGTRLCVRTVRTPPRATCYSEKWFRPYVRGGGHLRVTGSSDELSANPFKDIDVDLRSDATGRLLPGGRVAIGFWEPTAPRYSGTASCLNIVGNEAVVAFAPDSDPTQTIVLAFEDNGGGGKDLAVFATGGTSGNCAPPDSNTRSELTDGRALVEPLAAASG